MSASVCVFCGELKQGAFTPCKSCKEAPTSEIDLAYAIALSTHYMPIDVLQQLSKEMLAGRPRPVFPGKAEQHYRQIARQWMDNPIYKMVNRAGSHPASFSPETKGSVKGKNVLGKFLTGYIAVGGMLATILWASYLWPLTLGSGQYFPQSSFYERTIIIWKVQPIAVVYSIVRAIFWGPSLVIWAVDNSPNYSFGKWLAPGFYAEEWEIKKRDER